ncbi:MAG: glycosyltransferase N-terminal domain-containing protein [Agriterribacter sp.]
MSPWNPKAKSWISGRVNFFDTLTKQLNVLPKDNAHRIWMHCASLGEFEQGRPVLEKIKEQFPSCTVIISFFSPSGYEVRKNYKGADIVCYLPADTKANARQFVEKVNPTLVLWVRYEFWMHYLEAIHQRKIPLLLISGHLRNPGLFVNFYNAYRKRLFQCFTHFFVQTDASATMFNHMGFDNVTVSGDTRFDRVIEIAEKFEPVPIVEQFCAGHKVVVAGSTWTEDEEELTHYVRVNPSTRFIIAPHETDKENIHDIQKEFPHSILYSTLASGTAVMNEDNKVNTLIIDNVGMLSRLYKYADITYVGGGFGDDGLHNILEAAVYGKPVFFGPVYERHFEAVEMEECGGAISIENALALEKELDQLWNDPAALQKSGDAAKAYVYKNAGATNIILNYIYKNRLLTN